MAVHVCTMYTLFGSGGWFLLRSVRSSSLSLLSSARLNRYWMGHSTLVESSTEYSNSRWWEKWERKYIANGSADCALRSPKLILHRPTISVSPNYITLESTLSNAARDKFIFYTMSTNKKEQMRQRKRRRGESKTITAACAQCIRTFSIFRFARALSIFNFPFVK